MILGVNIYILLDNGKLIITIDIHIGGRRIQYQDKYLTTTRLLQLTSMDQHKSNKDVSQVYPWVST